MPRKPTPRQLAAAFLILSAALAVALLAVRNLYDDEIFSLDFIRAPLSTILSISVEGDVHPPGMYLFAHLAYAAIPSFRWLNLIPTLVLYTGLAVFLIQITPLFTRTRAQLCVLLLATLHPQILMWGNTFRWYSWWTGLALITLTVAIQPAKPLPTLATTRALTVALLLAGLLYLNYITLLFLLALAPAIYLRYRSQPLKPTLTRCLLALTVFAALIAPQLRTMLTVHIPAGRAQRYSLPISILRLLQSIATSEAYLPWHPLAILAALLFFALCLAGVLALRSRRPLSLQRPITPIAVFGLIFLVLVALSGLGGKPRNGLLLIPVLAVVATLIVETLRARIQTAVLLAFTIWIAVGVAHLFGRTGLTKTMMTDHPEQVVAFLRSQPPCSVVLTYDSALAFELAQSRLPGLMIVSPYRGPVFGGDLTLPPDTCAHPTLYLVHSYLGGTATHTAALNAELATAQSYMKSPSRTAAFSPDPDAPIKRRLARLSPDLTSVDRLPDLRYTVTSGLIDRTDLDPMRRRLPAFLSGFQSSVEESHPPE